MSGRLRRSKVATRTGLAVGAVLLVVGVAHASIPGADGRIKGCYDADPAGSGGVLKDLYVVDGDPCPAGTAEVTWNERGPTGDTGAVGPTGAMGPTGAQGPPGSSAKPGVPNGVYRTDVRFQQETVEIHKLDVDESATVDCRSNETAIGGGADLMALRIGGGYYALLSSYPVKQERSWFVRYTQVNAFSSTKLKPSFKPVMVIQAWAVCARTLVTAAPPMPPATGVRFGPRP